MPRVRDSTGYDAIMSKRGVRGKFQRQTVKAIEQAGGTVGYTRNGHLQVTGPGGTAILASDGGSWRGGRNNRATLRKHAGLEI